jgi:hypothetical protein
MTNQAIYTKKLTDPKGTEVDPEGILTGKGAIKFAEFLESEARAIEIDLANG